MSSMLDKEIIKTYGKPIILENKELFKISLVLTDDFFLTKEERENIKKELEAKEEKVIEKSVSKPVKKINFKLTNKEWLDKQIKKIKMIQNRDYSEFHFKSDVKNITFEGNFKGQKFEWEELWHNRDLEKMYCSEMWDRYKRLRIEQICYLLDDSDLYYSNILQIQRMLEKIPFDISYQKIKHKIKSYDFDDYDDFDDYGDYDSDLKSDDLSDNYDY